MKAQLLKTNALSDGHVDAIACLLKQSFDGVSRQGVLDDLSNKTHVLLLYQDSHLAGVSTLAVYPATHPDGQPVEVVCSGDTVVAKDAWGTPALARSWIQAVRSLGSAEDGSSLYWLLICSGFRTFRFLPVFFKTYWPSDDHEKNEQPESLRQWAHALATDRFGPLFNAHTGIVRFPQPQTLCEGLAEIPPGRKQQSDVARFLSLNPTHAEGDELVCLCSLAHDNLTPAGQRMLGQPLNKAVLM